MARHEITYTLTEADQLALIDGWRVQRVLVGFSFVPAGYTAIATLSFGAGTWPWFWTPVVWAAFAALLALWYRFMIRKAVRAGREQNPLFLGPVTWTIGPEGLAFRGGASRGSLPWSRFVGAEQVGGWLHVSTGPRTRLSAPVRAMADPERVLADIRAWIAAPEEPTPKEPPGDALIADTELREHDYVELLAPEPPPPHPPARLAVEALVVAVLFGAALAIRNPPVAYLVLVGAAVIVAARWLGARRWERALRRVREAPGCYLVGPHRFALGEQGIHVISPGGGWAALDWPGMNGWRETDGIILVTHGGLMLPIAKRGCDVPPIRAALERYAPRPPVVQGPARPPRSGTPDPFEAPET